MFSEALKVLDENTVKYMIEELQDQVAQEKEIRKQAEAKQKQTEIELQQSKEEIAHLKALLVQKQ